MLRVRSLYAILYLWSGVAARRTTEETNMKTKTPQAAHTNGPWIVESWTRREGESVTRFVIATPKETRGAFKGCQEIIGECASEANARLIAAAPDLLAALEQVTTAAAQGWSGELLKVALDKARAAIAAARGGGARPCAFSSPSPSCLVAPPSAKLRRPTRPWPMAGSSAPPILGAWTLSANSHHGSQHQRLTAAVRHSWSASSGGHDGLNVTPLPQGRMRLVMSAQVEATKLSESATTNTRYREDAK